MVEILESLGLTALKVIERPSGEKGVLVPSDGMMRNGPRWSPDGKQLAYSRRLFTNQERTAWERATVLLPVVGGDERVLASIRSGASDHTPLDDIAPPAVSIALRHHAGASLVSYFRVKAVGAHDAAGPSEVQTGAYTMVDGALGWRWTSRLQVLGTIRNLLDEAYQSSAGPRWVWAPGRHASITLVFTY